MSPTRAELLDAAEHFCDAFAQKQPVDTILSYFSTTEPISAIEHGEPCLAGFIGRCFQGSSEIKEYFDMLSSLLTYEQIMFSDFIVDPETRRVALKGQGKFTWLNTNQSWDEIFAYALDFDEHLKVTRYQVWADSGAAYLASIGELNNTRR